VDSETYRSQSALERRFRDASRRGHRYGHLYDAARERLRDHLDATYAQTTSAGLGNA
jgi:hypothetical protein